MCKCALFHIMSMHDLFLLRQTSCLHPHPSQGILNTYIFLLFYSRICLFSHHFIYTVILTRKTTYYPGHGQLNDASIFCIYVFNHCATLRPSRFLNHSTRDIFVVYVVKILGHRTRCQDELLQHFNMNLALRACGLWIFTEHKQERNLWSGSLREAFIEKMIQEIQKV